VHPKQLTPAPPAISPTAAFVALALTLLTFLSFLPVLRCGFTDFDDPEYVTHNPQVQAGLTAADIRWAWTSDSIGYWQPLSWMSLMLDTTLFGPGPEGYHRTNLILHALSAGIAFLVLSRLTGTIWRAALVAGIYAVHPLRVESVAWVAERKDVLSNLFAWLTIGGYVAYARAPNPRRYLLVLIPFVLGLLAKPMLVTLPCLLLLLDYWPLRRTGFRSLILEKLPLFLMALIAGAAAVSAQRRCMALVSFDRYPLQYRIGTILLGYGLYLRKMIWFADLSVFYPLPTVWTGRLIADAAACAGLLAAITAITIAQRRNRPWLLVGWLWFVGVLAPVSGIFQAGPQALADRFTYLPCVGLLVMLVWSLPIPPTADDLPIITRRRIALVAGSVLLLLSAATWVQAGYWKDTRTLFTRALAINERNWVAHDQLGLCAYRQGDLQSTMRECRRALQLNPIDPVAHVNLGLALQQLGRDHDAISQFQAALAVRFNIGLLHTGLAVALEHTGDLQGAYAEYQRALALSPDDETAHGNLGSLMIRVAVAKLKSATGPTAMMAHKLINDGILDLRQALQLDPQNQPRRLDLQHALSLKQTAAADTSR